MEDQKKEFEKILQQIHNYRRENSETPKPELKCRLCGKTDANTMKRRTKGSAWFCGECWRTTRNYSAEKERHCANCWGVILTDLSDVWLTNKHTKNSFCNAECAYKYSLPKDVQSVHSMALALSKQAASKTQQSHCQLCAATLNPKQGEKGHCHHCAYKNKEIVCPLCPGVGRNVPQDKIRYFPCPKHSVMEEKEKAKLVKEGLSADQAEKKVREMRKRVKTIAQQLEQLQAHGEEEKECSNCFASLPKQYKKNKNGTYLCNDCGIYEWRHGRPRPLACDGYFGMETAMKPPCSECQTNSTQSWVSDYGKRTICNACFVMKKSMPSDEHDLWTLNFENGQKRMKYDCDHLCKAKSEEPKTVRAETSKKTEEEVKKKPASKIEVAEEANETPAAPPLKAEKKTRKPSESEEENFEIVNDEGEAEQAQGIVGTIASWMPFF
ncbi:hypothetical protein L596_015485 [Steinernema carpocapsae]|uniref:GATA-type domain-containing protein n=1 Tax=Steinernema carpocapsae TaxID=34508 RepID=A0A4U5NG01_STECR|nr:hypothetical protein L596_015485 [Steinernema carpocapsae]